MKDMKSGKVTRIIWYKTLSWYRVINPNS
jgi:hypothetical protein